MKVGSVDFLGAVSFSSYSNVFDGTNLTRPDSDYEYRIGDFYREMAMPLGSSIKTSLYGQVFKNFGAEGGVGDGYLAGDLDPEEEDMGWVIGVKGFIGPFGLGYAYAQVEADSVVPLLKDATFGSGISNTDVKGHKINASYKITPNCSFDVTAWFMEALERANQSSVDLYQIDLNYRF